MVSDMLFLLVKCLINEQVNEYTMFSNFFQSRIINPSIELTFSFEEAGHLNFIGLQDKFLAVAYGNNNGILRQLFRLTTGGTLRESEERQNFWMLFVLLELLDNKYCQDCKISITSHPV